MVNASEDEKTVRFDDLEEIVLFLRIRVQEQNSSVPFFFKFSLLFCHISVSKWSGSGVGQSLDKVVDHLKSLPRSVLGHKVATSPDGQVVQI